MSEPYRVLLAALVRATPGDTWTVDGWRDEADLAQLTSAERGAAHQQAVDDGYLTPLGGTVGGVFHTFTIPTTHPAGKGRRVVVYERTGKALPGQAAPERHLERVPGQLALIDVP